jgi:hypothetical protein
MAYLCSLAIFDLGKRRACLASLRVSEQQLEFQRQNWERINSLGGYSGPFRATIDPDWLVSLRRKSCWIFDLG